MCMLAGVRVVLVVPVCGVLVLRVAGGARVWGFLVWRDGCSVALGRPCGCVGVSRLVEKQFEEQGLVCPGQCGCMLQVYVDAVRELCCHFGDGRALHVRRCGLGVLHVGA